MSEQEIMRVILMRKQFESEMAILRDCIDDLNDYESSEDTHQLALLKRRLTLIDHWLDYLPFEERMVVEMHLVIGMSWQRMSMQIEREFNGEISCDARTLQRAQERAIKRLAKFINHSFVNKLDYLIEDVVA